MLQRISLHSYCTHIPGPLVMHLWHFREGKEKKKKQSASKSDGKYSSRDSAVTPALQNRGAFVALTSGRLVTVLPPPLTPKPWRC